MTKVKHIGSLQNVPCDAVRKHAYYRDGPDTDLSCKWKARYRLGGKNLCRKHAEVEALAILADEVRVTTAS